MAGILCVLLGMVLAGTLGCQPRVAPRGPGAKPAAATRPAGSPVRAPTAAPPAREMLVGEMCPQGASGRPAVMPLFVRRLTWSAAAADAVVPVERRTARQFSVLGWDGRRVGVFSVAGLAEVGLERAVAAGAYAGGSSCASKESAGGEAPSSDPTCVSAQAHCGLALAVLDESGGLDAMPFEEDPDPISLPVGGACVVNGNLLVDVDGDEEPEAFPVAQFVDPVRAPAEEVVSVPSVGARCAGAFALRHVVPPGDPKHWQGLDLLGVLDIDGDGRRELVMVYHYPGRRTWAIYSALATAGRLDLVGEAEPWPAR